jgi:RNA polymerase sigma-70 factor (ECF subfamily)
MYNIAYRILHNRNDAEDAVQNAFMSLINHLDIVKDVNDNKTKSFIVIITRNASIDIYRRNRKRVEEPYEEQDTALMSNEPSLEELEISKEAFQILLRKIQSLDHKFADVVILKYVHQLSNEEIGKVLHISQDNVRLRLFRAKRMLLEILRGETRGK